MKDYPHKLIITRGNPVTPGGSQDDDGVWVPDSGASGVNVVYSGLADVQDGGKTVERDNLGSPTPKSEAVAFLKDERLLSLIKPEDTAEITWEDKTTDLAVVVKVRRLDGAVFLRRV